MAKAWNDDDLTYTENACKNMAFEWFDLVDFDESLLLNQNKFKSLVQESLGVDADDQTITASFKRLDVNGDGYDDLMRRLPFLHGNNTWLLSGSDRSALYEVDGGFNDALFSRLRT